MASLRFMSLPIFFMIFFTIIYDCESSYFPSMPPVPGPSSPVPATPSYPGVPASPTIPAVPEPCPDAPAPISYPPVFPPEPRAPSSAPPFPSHYWSTVKAAYWPSFNDFPASSIETSYFTHIYYAFLLPEPDTFKLDVTPYDEEKMPEFMDALRARNPPVKTLLSIGGGGNNATVFAEMVSTKTTRTTFINSTIEVARKYGFDGVDLDWEFPANDQEMSNLAILYKEWRKALNVEAKISGKSRLLLTSAVYFASKFTNYGEPRAYPGHAMGRYLDWASPMCFDYHGSWENFTGAHAALYDPKSNISTDFGIGSWIQAGLPPKKLVMGLPLYGKTWKLQDPNVNGLGALAVGVGPGGGILTYNEIVEFNIENNGTTKYDSETVSHYSYVGDYWAGYDDILSVMLKIRFAKLHELGGYFFWALGQDRNWTISEQAAQAWGR